MEFVGEPDTVFAGLGLGEAIPLDLEHVAHELAILLVILNDQDQLIRHGAPAA